MRILFWLGFIVSGFITIAAFAITNLLTVPFDPSNLNGGGNVALFFIAFPFLIILYFFFKLMLVFEKIHDHFQLNVDILKTIYFTSFVLLVSFTVYRIFQFKQKIQPYFEYEIGYLNPFTNHLFFNVWTFLACLCISALGSFYLKFRLKPVEISNNKAEN
ncbi:hypothetical protein [Solibacillus sp. FSL K6-1523]|uniref:hypothetical protein n=1 Tax=Solibacillus sp. FSL K6-1523 TaxID=2921471 RepID=UPI0030F5B5CF